jgi:putative transposase
MPNTYTQLYVQLVFAVKGRQPLLRKEWKDELYKYVTGIVKNNGSKMLSINGVAGHIHIFAGINPAVAISELVKDIKLGSGSWINKKYLKDLIGKRVMRDFHMVKDKFRMFAIISKIRKCIIEK